MTNAEKLAKDVDKLVSIISFAEFCNDFGNCSYNCYGCPLFDKPCTKEGLKEWLESEAEEEELAIWKYDNFPYMKIGKVEYKNADGTVEVGGYDGMRFKPMKIIPYDETLINKFDVILEGHRKAQKEAEKRTLRNLRTLLGFESEATEDESEH